MSGIPKRYQELMSRFPEVGNAYEALGNAVHAAGPLDERTRALVKIAVSTGARLDGAVHSHVRKARKSGVTYGEMVHVVLLSLPTIGFPAMMSALKAVDEIMRPMDGDKENQ
ncbi:MAG: carboxymuconolactone decarboxylase family protein [Bacteroidetes bacterium]|nr:MAG: carboxymuconolactone decarboxylase family protein [Bacteroidota bacterium]